MMHDLLLVGGGLSSATVLMRLAADHALPPGSTVALVDPAGETGGGAAYQRTVHPALLLQDPVAKLDRTGLGFGRWLVGRATQLHSALGELDDPRVRGWLQHSGDALARGDVASLYVPRQFLGVFVRERFMNACSELAVNGVSVSVISAAVTDVRSDGSCWRIALDHSLDTLQARAVVLGIGGPVAPRPFPLLPYFRGSGLDLAAVERGILGAGGGDVLLLGSAASAVEMVYCIEADPRLRNMVDRVVTISPSGRLPDGLPSGSSAPFPARRIGLRHLTASELVKALEDDVLAARRALFTIPDVYPTLHAEFQRGFRQLSSAEKKCMVDVFSRTYLSLLRKTSPIYAAGARRLAGQGKLVNVPGRVEAVTVKAGGFEVTVNGNRRFSGSVVLDCRGFGDLATDPFLGKLIRSGVVQPNESGLGLRVDAGFEAARGLAVLGPLLAGTAQGGEYIWHLEDVPRIHAYADRIARTVINRIQEHATELPYSPPVVSS